jgi:transcriptional regulator with XRE-family HTH domain
MTQEQLANLLGVSSQAVSKWETSETYPDGSILVLLANTLEVSLDRLFGNQNLYVSDISTSLMKLIDKEDYENRFEVVAKCKRDTLASNWAPIPFPNIETDGKNDALTDWVHVPSGYVAAHDPKIHHSNTTESDTVKLISGASNAHLGSIKFTAAPNTSTFV